MPLAPITYDPWILARKNGERHPIDVVITERGGMERLEWRRWNQYSTLRQGKRPMTVER